MKKEYKNTTEARFHEILIDIGWKIEEMTGDEDRIYRAALKSIRETEAKIIGEANDQANVSSNEANPKSICCNSVYYLAPRMSDDKFIPHCSKCNSPCELQQDKKDGGVTVAFDLVNWIGINRWTKHTDRYIKYVGEFPNFITATESELYEMYLKSKATDR